ncbi:MAG TPA: acyl carrier protein [Actinocrinis sp.]|jgi:acyl carrier protein
MRDEIRDFVISTLRTMNYDVSDVTGATMLGPAGLDLESLGLADLAVQIEERYGVQFELDDMEGTALMTLDEFSADVAARSAAGAVGGSAVGGSTVGGAR